MPTRPLPSAFVLEFTVFSAFTLCGFFAGVAGVLWGIYFGGIDSTTADGQVLVVIAAVVVGGVSIAGGSGTVIGAALGALFLGLVNNALLDPERGSVVAPGHLRCRNPGRNSG